MSIIKIGGVREGRDASQHRYTNEEGMRIAREFADEMLAQYGEDFRLLAVIGSVSRGSELCGDVDIAVVYTGGVVDRNHPIHLKQEDYRKTGKSIDVLPLFWPELSGRTNKKVNGRFHRDITLRSLESAIPLHENPVGYLVRLREYLSKNPSGCYFELEQSVMELGVN
ncbi:MAG TPA: hypothetical protein VJA47_06115 [archaeon]|nr:hypothetical protein [archaeon]